MTTGKPMPLFSQEEIVLISAGAVVVGASIVIGSQVAAGVFVGLVSGSGIAYTIYKTRTSAPHLFNLIIDKPLASDLVIDAGVFLLVGGTTVTGIVAGASASLFTSIAISGLRKLGKCEAPPFNLREKLSRFKPV